MSTVEKESSIVWVTFQLEGIHCYPEAATMVELQDVSFLAHPHRHMFHFKVSVPVSHDNRDIEFIQLKRYCISLFEKGTLQLNNSSCEMMASSLAEQVTQRYHKKGSDWVCSVEVSEDGENGALYVYAVDEES